MQQLFRKGGGQHAAHRRRLTGAHTVAQHRVKMACFIGEGLYRIGGYVAAGGQGADGAVHGKAGPFTEQQLGHRAGMDALGGREGAAAQGGDLIGDDLQLVGREGQARHAYGGRHAAGSVLGNGGLQRLQADLREQLLQPAGLALVRNIRLVHLPGQLGQSRGQGAVLFAQSGARRAVVCACRPPRSLFGGGHIDGVGQPHRCLAPPLQNRGQVRRGHAVWHGNERRKIVERVVGLAGAVHPAIQAFATGLAATLRHGVAQVGSGLAPGRQPFAYGLHGVAHGAQRAGHSLQPPGERGERRP